MVSESSRLPWGAAWRNKAQAVAAIAISLLIVLVGVVLYLFYLHWNGDLNAFRSAPTCTSPADAFDSGTCKYEGPSKVLSADRTAQLHATIGFDSVAGRTLTATFYTNQEPSPDQVAVGATPTVQVWQGKVTALAGIVTVDNPVNEPITPTGQVAPFVVVAGLVLLFVASMMARAAWRQKTPK